MNEEQTPQPEEIKTPLLLLRTLCILTFIGSGLGIINFSILVIMPDFILKNLNVFPDPATQEFIKLIIVSGGSYFTIISFFLYIVSLAGAILMWKMYKVGFHLYTSAQLLLLIIPYLYIPEYPMSFMTIFITLAFIFSYSVYLKQMK